MIKENKIIGVIPAHLSSVRFPRKILHSFLGLPMIEHVRRRALLAKNLSDVYVATCDNEIEIILKKFGANVIRTSSLHKNGTSRVAEAIENIKCSHVVLLQGDEPLILPDQIDHFVESMNNYGQSIAWNATAPLLSNEELDKDSFVKCILSNDDNISFFCRKSPFLSKFTEQKQIIRKVMGIIGYEKNFLLKLVKLPPSIVETLESIEQARIIDNGFKVRSVDIKTAMPSVNYFEEAEIVYKQMQEDVKQKIIIKKIL
jgi:3-deoxy-manno-octulosonate cytidylyltransferase (CMP-KDO synthetase)